MLNHNFYQTDGRERLCTARSSLSLEKFGLLIGRWKIFLKISIATERKMVNLEVRVLREVGKW